MTLRLQDKKRIVKQLVDVANHSSSVVAVGYRGLTVKQMDKLRVEAYQADVHIQVVRNNLASRALEATEFSCLREVLIGPVFLAFSKEDMGAAARLLRSFMKVNEILEIRGLSVAGQLLEASALNQIADLPTQEQASVSLVLSLMSPFVRSVKVMSAVYIQFVRICSKIIEQKRDN